MPPSPSLIDSWFPRTREGYTDRASACGMFAIAFVFLSVTALGVSGGLAAVFMAFVVMGAAGLISCFFISRLYPKRP